MALDATKGVRHLDHLEDLILLYGKEGAKLASETIDKFLRKFERGAEESSDLTISEKIDGCIHRDEIIKTTAGDKRIIEIIFDYLRDKELKYKCYGFNMKTKQEEIVDIINPRINRNGKRWVEVETIDGIKHKVTEDHEFFVQDKGWVEARNLKENDNILEYKG